MPLLTERLRCVATCVRRGRVVADIGTDHAHLPVALVSAGICPRAIAGDVVSGPVDAARRTVTEAGLTDKIDVRLGDGLAVLRPEEAQEIVIAGMGGETVAAILEAAEWIRDARYHLILQPMTRAEDLRRWLLTHGFSIPREHAVREGRRWYLVIEAVFTGQPPVTDEAVFYHGRLDPREGLPLLMRKERYLSRREQALRAAGNAEQADRLAAIRDRLCRYIGADV